ncbi:MAG: transglutaminase domain-containing protein [Oscillospiraceae bacterium]
MRRNTVIFAAVAAAAVLACAGTAIALNSPDSAAKSDVPEFVFEDSAQEQLPATPTADVTSSQPQASTATTAKPSPAETAEPVQQEPTAPQTEPQPPAETTVTLPAEPDEPQSAAVTKPQTTTKATSRQPQTTTTKPQTTTSQEPQSAAETTQPELTAELAEISTSAETAEAPQEQLPDNVLLTSDDLAHYIRMEFQPDSVQFTGVYTGEEIGGASVLRENRQALDLTQFKSSFSGSIDLSGLAEGYYILRFTTGSGSVMDYVFEVTEQGAQPLTADELPTEKNLSVTRAPLKIPADTVLKLITADGDPERAAEVMQEVQEISDTVCNGIIGELDKARALAEWMAKNIYYDTDAKDTGVTDDMLTLEHILLTHRSVCYGWTNLYSALCQAQGIECYNVNGSVVTGSRCFLQTDRSDERAHSWNMLIIDGEKLWVDTVWNSSNTYKEGLYKAGKTDMQYFCITNLCLAQDHRAERCEYRDYPGAIE